MAIQEMKNLHMRRPDEAIDDEIWLALWQEETIRSIDFHDISVDVERGQVCLSGHVSNNHNHQRIGAITRSITGVIAVHNHLVSDYDLSLQVAQALGEDERTRLLVLPVYSSHGWVELCGTVPNRATQRAAEAAAAGVPDVRGVILPPNIAGEQPEMLRKAVQPRIGALVFGEEETEGRIHQVVINPQNRLVTHAMVRVFSTHEGCQAWCDYLVPVEVMDVVDAGGIFLYQETNVLSGFPVFNPIDYPFAPLTWQPPYPYKVGSVRWPRLDKIKAAPNY